MVRSQETTVAIPHIEPPVVRSIGMIARIGDPTKTVAELLQVV